MTDRLTTEALHAEIEAAIGRAARIAWRQLSPNWREVEAEIALVAATAAVSREHPEYTEGEILAELRLLGVVTFTATGPAVCVPALNDVPLPAPGGLQ